MKVKKMDDNEYKKLLKRFIVPTLRRASYRWPERNESLKAAKLERGVYKCANCELPHPRKNVQIDHIEPVVPLEVTLTTQSWDSYIERMFCTRDKYQILCEQCHDLKSSMEVQTRKANRAKLKKKCKKSVVKKKRK